jgi:hypothetical protein
MMVFVILHNYRFDVFFVFIALAGLLVFIFHFESNHLARKYGRDGYGEGGNGTGYRGFFHLERSDFGSFRWSGKRGTIRFNQPGVVEFDYLCLHPDVEKKPVVFEVLLDGELIDEIVFVKKGKKKGRYYLSGAGGNAQTLRFEVSRTWNPRKYKINRDTRELGIGISPGYFVRRFPEDGVGFYEEEDMSVFPDGWAAGGAGVFRWTAKRASISIKQVHRERGLVFFVRASHPDLSPDSPVWLTVLGDRTKIRKIAVKNEWDRLQLSPEDLAGNRTITLRVNRTWVPRIYGVSEDDRNLGVAVAFE